jgi:hypothetical protein
MLPKFKVREGRREGFVEVVFGLKDKPEDSVLNLLRKAKFRFKMGEGECWWWGKQDAMPEMFKTEPAPVDAADVIDRMHIIKDGDGMSIIVDPVKAPPKSWKIGVKTHRDEDWSTNAMRYATEAEAMEAARELKSRWLAVIEYCAQPSDDEIYPAKVVEQPEPGKVYALTAKQGEPCIANGDTLAECEVKPVEKIELSPRCRWHKSNPEAVLVTGKSKAGTVEDRKKACYGVNSGLALHSAWNTKGTYITRLTDGETFAISHIESGSCLGKDFSDIPNLALGRSMLNHLAGMTDWTKSTKEIMAQPGLAASIKTVRSQCESLIAMSEPSEPAAVEAPEVIVEVPAPEIKLPAPNITKVDFTAVKEDALSILKRQLAAMHARN